tara:strand:+ start:692 stop:883 length:192 start_codon:yes stop_codon:yes gene_type:complete
VTKPTPKATTATSKAAPAKRPTPEQLQALRRGGSYTFNPANGNFGKHRSATKPAAQHPTQEAE